MLCFINCLIFLIISGLIIFFIGRLIPRRFIKENKYPYKSFLVEKNGEIYNKINIKRWKTKLPDASVIVSKLFKKLKIKFPYKFFPVKRINRYDKESINILIKESCIAETNHILAGIIGFGCTMIWKNIGGWIISILYFLWNVPFVLIQRYNRPRLLALMNKY